MNKKICRCFLTICLTVVVGMHAAPVLAAADDPFVGDMIWVPYNFAPQGWAFCDGQLLSINEYSTLFALIGTTYGGDGYSTFALPDMRGKQMIHAGQGAGLSNHVQGQTGGAISHTLTLSQMPVHSHAFQASTVTGTATTPSNSQVYAQPGAGNLYGTNATAALSASAVGPSVGNGQSHNNMMPYVTLNCIIALEGEWPQQP